ncbi:MAG TPA: hypothetical protein PK364_05730 [Synergistaceae bacterium]|nr:hypothetical protein [Synergistaceae bacterium]
MLLNIFNGSPRGKRSNSAILTRAFAKGFCDSRTFPGNRFEEFFLADPEDFEKAPEAFFKESTALLAFPIYVDAMPGITKKFIEALEPYKGRCEFMRTLFLVQTGFPEETHTRPMKNYLLKLGRRLGAPLPALSAWEAVKEPGTGGRNCFNVTRISDASMRKRGNWMKRFSPLSPGLGGFPLYGYASYSPWQIIFSGIGN